MSSPNNSSRVHADRRAHRRAPGADARERRDPIPDLAIEEWLDFAVDLDADCIELSAAIHPDLSDIPAEAMLDPVANTLDLREPFDK